MLLPLLSLLLLLLLSLMLLPLLSLWLLMLLPLLILPLLCLLMLLPIQNLKLLNCVQAVQLRPVGARPGVRRRRRVPAGTGHLPGRVRRRRRRLPPLVRLPRARFRLAAGARAPEPAPLGGQRRRGQRRQQAMVTTANHQAARRGR